MYYLVKKDPECDGLVVIFGTEEEIQNDQLEGDGVDVDDFNTLQVLLDDTGELCEDYLIVSEKYQSKSDIPNVKKIVEKFGYVENKSLSQCGWG